MSTPNGSRARRLVLSAALLVLAIALVWQVAKLAIDLDLYRSQIEQALGDYTGLPVSIGELELAWRPTPCLSAHDVSIGADDFHALVPRFDVFPRIWPLLRRRLEIASIQLTQPAITLPRSAAELAARRRTLFERIAAAREVHAGPQTAQVLIEELTADRAFLRFGEQDAHPIVTTVTATWVGAQEIEFALDAEVPSAGMHAIGELRVPLQESGEVTGTLEVEGVQPARFAALPAFADAEWRAHAQLSGTFAQELVLAVKGRFDPIEKVALAGTFAGAAKIAPDGATSAELAIDGEDLAIQSSALLFAGERSRVRVKAAHAGNSALATLLAALNRDPFAFSVVDRAALDVRNLEIALAPEPRLTKGTVVGQGIALAWKGRLIADDLRLEARAANGVFQIAALRGGPIELRGVTKPIDGLARAALDLTGSVAFDAKLMRALGAPEALQDASGTIAIEELRTELPAPAEGRAPLALRARLPDGALHIVSGAIEDTISGIDFQLVGDGATLRLDGRATGEALGPIEARATWDSASGDLRGGLSLIGGTADFLRGTTVRRMVAPVLRAYTGTPLDFEMMSETEPVAGLRIRVHRESAPRVRAALALRSEPPDDLIQDIDVSADVPAESLRGFLPEAARVSGMGSLRIRRATGSGIFLGEADLDAIEIADGDYLEKKPGEVLRVRLDGVAGPSWDVHRLLIAGEQAAVPLELSEHGVSARDLDIDLAGFSFLLVDGARASGRLRGNLDSSTHSAELELADVGVWLSPDLNVDAANGSIAVAKDSWAVSDLRVKSAETDLTLDVAVQEGRLTGKATGARLDGDFARVFYEQFRAFQFAEDEPESPPVSGTVLVALDQVGYRRGEARKVTAAIEVEQDDVHVRRLALEAYEGHVAGQVDIDVREDEPPLLALDLDFADVGGRFLDDALFEEERGIRGLFTGKLRFVAPVYDDLRAMLSEGRGTLTATARDGTFGRIGLATKLVTVLRSTEALRMRLPVFHDEGLVFDTVSGEAEMEQGRAAIRRFELDSTSYAIRASGEVNFRENDSRVPIEVNAIKGITGIVDRVPVAGDALKIVNVRLVATGSPYDLELRIASITDQLIGAGLAGPKAVINGVRDVLDLMRSAGGRSSTADPEPPVEPAPESSPEAPSTDSSPAPNGEAKPTPETEATPSPGR